MAKQEPVKRKLPKKSKRERRRYILFESVEMIPFGELKHLVKKEMPYECNVHVLKFFPEKKLGVLRCKRGTEEQVSEILKSLNLRSLRCSGCVKGLKKPLEK